GKDQAQGGGRTRLIIRVPVRAVPATAVGHLLRRQAEQEKIFFVGFLSHLDGSAVTRADGQRAIHHELHVACATGLIARGRDLVRDITGGDQALGGRHAILRQEYHFESVAPRRVARDR